MMQPETISSSEDVTDTEITNGNGKSTEKQKSSKPVMEKRRRARINHSLNELKSILLEALKKDSTRHSKLEKADILEMTVNYLRNVERQKLSMSLSIDPAVVDKYKAGFNQCRNEVMKFLSTCEGVTVEIRTRLLNHLATCLHCINTYQTNANMFDNSVLDNVPVISALSNGNINLATGFSQYSFTSSTVSQPDDSHKGSTFNTSHCQATSSRNFPFDGLYSASTLENKSSPTNTFVPSQSRNRSFDSTSSKNQELNINSKLLSNETFPDFKKVSQINNFGEKHNKVLIAEEPRKNCYQIFSNGYEDDQSPTKPKSIKNSSCLISDNLISSNHNHGVPSSTNLVKTNNSKPPIAEQEESRHSSNKIEDFKMFEHAPMKPNEQSNVFNYNEHVHLKRRWRSCEESDSTRKRKNLNKASSCDNSPDKNHLVNSNKISKVSSNYEDKTILNSLGDFSDAHKSSRTFVNDLQLAYINPTKEGVTQNKTLNKSIKRKTSPWRPWSDDDKNC